MFWQGQVARITRHTCALGTALVVACGGGGDSDKICVSSEAGPYCKYPPAAAATVQLVAPAAAMVGVPAMFSADIAVESARINSVGFCIFSNDEQPPYDACQFEDLTPIESVPNGERGTLTQTRTPTRSGSYTFRVLAFSAAEHRENTLAFAELVFTVAPPK